MWRIPYRHGYTPLEVYDIFDLDREVPEIPRPSKSMTWKDIGCVTAPEHLTAEVCRNNFLSSMNDSDSHNPQNKREKTKNTPQASEREKGSMSAFGMTMGSFGTEIASPIPSPSSSRPSSRNSAATQILALTPRQTSTSFDPSRLKLTPDEWFVPVTEGPPDHVDPTKSFQVFLGVVMMFDVLDDPADIVKSIYHNGELMGYIYSSHTLLKSGKTAVNPNKQTATGSAGGFGSGGARPAGMIIENESDLSEDGSEERSNARRPGMIIEDEASDEDNTPTTETLNSYDAPPEALSQDFTDNEKRDMLAAVATTLHLRGGDNSHISKACFDYRPELEFDEYEDDSNDYGDSEVGYEDEFNAEHMDEDVLTEEEEALNKLMNSMAITAHTIKEFVIQQLNMLLEGESFEVIQQSFLSHPKLRAWFESQRTLEDSPLEDSASGCSDDTISDDIQYEGDTFDMIFKALERLAISVCKLDMLNFDDSVSPTTLIKRMFANEKDYLKTALNLKLLEWLLSMFEEEADIDKWKSEGSRLAAVSGDIEGCILAMDSRSQT